MRATVEFASKARRDWKKLDKQARDRVARGIDALRTLPRPANLDDKPLEGLQPWRRLRVGEHRVIFRPLTAVEIQSRGMTGPGLLVARVIDRRDLERASKGLR